MATEMGVFLIGITSYNFPDQKSGEILQGVKIRTLSPAQNRPGVFGWEMSEFPASYDALSLLLPEVKEIMGDKQISPAILLGDFQKRGKNLTFVVSDIYPDERA